MTARRRSPSKDSAAQHLAEQLRAIDDANHALTAAVAATRRQSLLAKVLYGAGDLVLGRASCPLR